MAKILTPNGNTNVSTASPKFGTGAVIFDGVGDWIDTPNHAHFYFGYLEFTVDFWLKRSSNEAGNLYIAGQATSAGADELQIKLGGNQIQVVCYSTEPATYPITSTTTITDTDTWHHIAWVRDRTANKLRLFIDGTQEGTGVDIAAGVVLKNPTSKFAIGRYGEYATTPFNGRIDEFRVSKGIARWTSNFTPSTSAYSCVDAYTKLLVHFDGAEGSTSFTDDDTACATTITAKVITTNGDAQVSTTSPKFGTGALFVDGVGDWIDTPNHTDFDFDSGNFTVDFWMKRQSNELGNLYLVGQATSTGAEEAIVRLGANAIRFFINTAESGVLNTPDSTTTITDQDTWHHIAIVRNGNTLTQYIDGVADGTLDMTGKTAQMPTSRYSIGRAGDYATTPFNGRIDEFRISKGIARWTANFTPSGSAYCTDNDTKLLVHCDGTNTSTSFGDDIIPCVTNNGIFFSHNF